MYKKTLIEAYTVIWFAFPVLDHFTLTVSKFSYNLGFGGDLKYWTVVCGTAQQNQIPGYRY